MSRHYYKCIDGSGRVLAQEDGTPSGRDVFIEGIQFARAGYIPETSAVCHVYRCKQYIAPLPEWRPTWATS